jgi:hypothetical protein
MPNKTPPPVVPKLNPAWVKQAKAETLSSEVAVELIIKDPSL